MTVPGPYIHIGYHRTGSTFLQKRVFPSMPITSIIQPKVKELVLSEQFDARAWAARFIGELGVAGDTKMVISHEMFSGAPEGGGASRPGRTAERLREAFPGARIIVVVRRQPDYVLSVYGYRVMIRGLERESLAAYLEAHAGALDSNLQYDRLVAHYMLLFGAERVLVVPFEQLARDTPSFVGRIADFIGVSADLSYARDRVNESTRSAAVIAVHRALNTPFDLSLGALRRSGRVSHSDYLRLARPFFAFKERVLNPALRRAVGRRGAQIEMPAIWLKRTEPMLRASNRRLAALTGIDFASYGYLV